ncbi:MAG: PilN domain-containing protein [Candidatus Nanopelagicales bacterium]|nr:PilN domain-containing protein [Candidatus Nanopelagicales bacterium]MDZ4249370.1 PilN domain-containing protein [Candidatus Nanopelagicales bacterium]
MSASGGVLSRLRRRERDPSEFDERPIPGYVRVNLLPPQVIMLAKVRRARRIAASMVAAAVAINAGLWVLAEMDAINAGQELSQAESETAQLNMQMAQYSQVPKVFAAADLAQQSLAAAMGREVRWAFLLNQLSFSTPPGVTLNSITGQAFEAADSDGSEGSPETPANPALPVISNVGSMTFDGTAISFDSVASWLDSLEKIKDYTYPFLTNATASETGVDFNSTARLTDLALSGRYSTKPGTGTTPGTQPSPAPQASPTPAPTEPLPEAEGR